jgi:APA family basic amino acid/polyamine antiporter
MRRSGRAMSTDPPQLRPDLGRIDFTLLVIGAVVGADVYVVAAMGAGFLGPAQLVAWVAAGVLAALIALTFVQCAAIDSEVGGSYTYARTAFGPLIGFLAGWALYTGEFVALPVFPLAFGNYLERLAPGMPHPAVILAEVVLIVAVTGFNFVGVRKGARVNDLLTVAKLVPLTLLIALGLAFAFFRHSQASDHLHPFVPLGWGGFGSAIVPIFWAYAGFELAVLPAAEVRSPQRTLPQGLIVGMVIATIFYLLTAFAVVVAIPWQDAASSSSPLAAAMSAIFKGFGGSGDAGSALMSVGALVSIVGVYEAFTLGVARLSYALAADGLFPSGFARVHPKYSTPYVGLAFQALAAFLGATLFDLRGLITIAVFFLGISYLATALAALRLVARNPDRALRLPGLRPFLGLAGLSAVYLASQAPHGQIAIGAAVMLLGLVLYALRGAHWRQLADELETGERAAIRWTEHHYHWLQAPARRLRRAVWHPRPAGRSHRDE